MARTIASRRQKTSAGRFVGRFAEQQLFRATLRALAALHSRSDEQLNDDELSYAQIFLIAAEGGMGKTTLLRRFAAIVEENSEAAGAQALYLDCERHAPIADPDKLMRVLHDALCAAGFERQMQPYRDAITSRGAAQKKAVDAEEKYKSLATFGGKAAQLASGGLLDSELVAGGIHAGARGLADLREFIRKKLDPDEWKLYDDPDAVTELFMQALNSIATPKRPLVLLLDTYELADRCDTWLRKRALPQSNLRLIWALAGREGQPFIRRYEDAFGATLIGRILLDTFARPDIVAYLQQCGVESPDDELIERLQALSRGIPLALEGWFNLHQKNVELPPPDPAAPTTRRAIVRAMTDRFLRYCEDDKGLAPDERRQREATRNHILALMLLRRTDAAALAAAWQSSVEQAEATLNDMSDQFSFIFAQEIERAPHALVKEFLREHLRELPSLPTAMQSAVTRLVTHFELRLRGRERELWTTGSSSTPIAPTLEQATLLAEREAHQQRLAQLNIQLATYGVATPAHVRIDRDQAERAIAELDAKLAATSSITAADGPRRPLWNDQTWRETLLDLLNVLGWADRSGERAMRMLVPMFVEALEFDTGSADEILTTGGEFAQQWSHDHRHLFNILATGSEASTNPDAMKETMLAILDVLQPIADRWQLTALQRAILYVQRGCTLLEHGSPYETKPESRAAALDAADEAVRLLPTDGNELAETLSKLYKDVGTSYQWTRYDRVVVSLDAARALAAAVRFAPTNHHAWRELGISYAEFKQYDQAITALERAIDLDPTDGSSYNPLGNVYYRCKQYDKAMTAYLRATSLKPAQTGAYYNQGNVHLACKRYEEALDAYQQTIVIDPTFAWGYYGLGNLHKSLKRHDEAIAAYQQALDLDPSFAKVYNSLGEIYSLLNRTTDARDAYRHAIELDPQQSGAIFALARIERQLGNYEQVAALLEQARTVLPADDFYNRACLESIAGNADAAIEALRIALERGSSVEWARDDPDFMFIRDDPRYRALVGLDDARDG